MTPPDLRILHLADAIFEEKAGGSRQVARELMQEQILAGHNVTILVGRQAAGKPETWRDPLRGTIAQYEKGTSPGAWIQNGRDACAALMTQAEQEGNPFRLVHTHFAYAAVGALQAIGTKIPHIRSFYGPWDAEGFIEDMGLAAGSPAWKKPLLALRAHAKKAYRHRIEADNLRQSAQVIILSEQSRGEVADFGYPSERVVKVPGGVNRNRFHVDTSDVAARQKARARAGLPTDAFPLLLSVRRLVPRMGLENLVAAIPAIRARFPGVKLVIGGRGALKETLEAQAKSLGVSDVVTLAGFVPDDKIVDFYRGADIFVLPTLALEGFGLVTVEALACGTPVIGTPTGATPELLADLDQRLLAGGVEPTHLADAIIRFCEARQENGWASKLSAERLCGYVDARYTWEKHATEVEKVYRLALQK